MSDKFLSFLGTTPYISVNYHLHHRKVSRVRFVQEALVKMLCRGWGEGDRIAIFLTEEAEQKNWDSGYFKIKDVFSKFVLKETWRKIWDRKQT